jgi:hypothetical protein
MGRKNQIDWTQVQGVTSRSYTCGFCGHPLASEKGWLGIDRTGSHTFECARIHICHQCSRPTFFDGISNLQVPGVAFGRPVQNVSDDKLNAIYEESRRATSAGCYTAAVLCCRKLLMHLAVAKGAPAGDTFKSYVEFLEKRNYVPPDCKLWVEQIKDTGNEANHEVVMMKKEDAEHLIAFCEMLLKIFYEFPAVATARNSAKVAS